MYIQETKKQTQELITKTSKLQAKGQTLQLHSELVDAFLNKFQLKSEEKKMFLGAREDKLEPVNGGVIHTEFNSL